MNKTSTIKCPNCEAEYLPGEIFLPKYFLGQPTNIEKDIEGKILWHDGIDQDTTEKFTCTKCDTTFSVKANISYDTNYNVELDARVDYTSKKYGERLHLKEI